MVCQSSIRNKKNRKIKKNYIKLARNKLKKKFRQLTTRAHKIMKSSRFSKIQK